MPVLVRRDLLDLSSAASFPVWTAPQDGWLAWGARDRVLWTDENGAPRVAALIKSRPDGLEVEDPDGGLRLLGWGLGTVAPMGPVAPPDDEPLRKTALKAGQRWITVHPHGPGEKGVPILIQENPDGSHRVVAGAGGKLTHLHLRNVKPEKSKEEKAADDKDRRDAKREKEAGETHEEKSKRKLNAQAAREARREKERELVEKVRGTLGGIREDLTPEQKAALKDVHKLEDHQIKAIETAHHRAQYKEAVDRARQVMGGLVERETSRAEQRAVLGADENDPALHEARKMAALAFEAEQEVAETKGELRQTGRQRLTGGDPEVSLRAAESAAESLREGPDEALRDAAGRGDAAAQVAQRAVAAAEKARQLVEAADRAGKGEIDDEIRNALGDGAEQLSEADRRAKLLEAAGKAGRQAEVQRARMEHLEALQVEDPEAAWRALAFTDNLSRMAKDRKSAVQAGLVDAVMVGARDVDHAAAAELARDFMRHQKSLKEIRQAAAAGDTARIDAARRGFELNTEDIDQDVQLSVDDEVRRKLTENLLGAADQGRADYQIAVGAGHHDALADVALGIAGARHIDRLTLDALGLHDAALLQRYALQRAGHDPAHVLEALERHHVAEVSRSSAAALDRAEKVAPGLRAKLDEVGDFEQAAAQLKLHERDIKAAQETVGTAIGRLEATAALSQAFRQGGELPKTLNIDGKRAGMDRTLAWLHAAGLQPGDYLVDHGDKQIVVPQRVWHKLLVNESSEIAQQRAEVAKIKGGARDETGWLPPGIVRRAESTFTAPVPDMPVLAEPLNLKGAETAEEIRGRVEQHAGLRLAEGEHPADIMSDLLSTNSQKNAPNKEEYLNAVRAAFPVVNEAGRRVKIQDQAEHFQRLAERAMVAKYGRTTGAFHAQDLDVNDPGTHEALFRTLAEHPDGVVAFKPVGELTPQDQRVLRDAAYVRMGIDPKTKSEEHLYQAALSELEAEPDPTKGTVNMLDMIGRKPGATPSGPSPEWLDWKSRRDAIRRKFPRQSLETALAELGPRPADPDAAADHDLQVKALHEAAAKAPTAWSRFVQAHDSLELAQRAMQDEIKSRVVSAFHTHYGKITGRALSMGTADVTNPERHIKAVASAEEAAQLRAEAQSIYGKLRARDAGKFAAEGEGAVKKKFTRWMERDEINQQAQLGMFGAKPKPAAVARPMPEVEAGTRYTLGERAENQIGSLMGAIGRQFEPGKPVGLFPGLNMDGDRVHQQRVLRQLRRTKRVGGFLGVGSGKSLISIGGYTQAHNDGEASHGLFLVPAAVQAQFGAEMLRYTEPGRYAWQTGEGKSHDERVAMLKDAGTHMRVFTHQSFRATALKLMADHHKLDADQMRAKLDQASPRERARMMREAFDANGIPRHYVYYDEAHTAEAREDDDASATHLVRSAVTHPVNATHYLHGTGTPVKNDAGELWSMASALDPDRYGDRGRFLQNFGQATANAPNALRRELSHLTYTAKIPPEGVRRTDTDNPTIKPGALGGPSRKVTDGAPLELLPEHKALVDGVETAYQKARAARKRGEVDVEALKHLSPKSFANVPEAEHAEIADRLTQSLGMVKEAAMRRAVNGAPAEVNTKLQAMTRVIQHDLGQRWTDRKGKQRDGRASIVFTDRAEEARMIHEHLTRKGVRAALYHGGLTPEERDGVRLGFQPEGGGSPKYDVFVSTAAAEAGVNLQRASVIHHFDVPMTDKSHEQRSGRAFRQGQLGDVDIHNWHTDTEFEHTARKRLRDKALLAQVMQDPLPHLDEHGIAGIYRAVQAEQHQEAA